MPVIYRPLFNHLRVATCRTFETPPRNPSRFSRRSEVHRRCWQRGLKSNLPNEQPQEKIEILSARDRYARTVMATRQLAKKHSYQVRLRES